MIPAIFEQLVAGLDAPDVAARVQSRGREARGGRQAAVLIAFTAEAEGPRVVLIEKTGHLRKHAGQVAFPGGGVEPDDVSVVAAALREADEEVGLDPEAVRVLGVLPDAHVRASGFDVAPVVAWWRTPTWLAPADTHEIESVHVVPVRTLVDPVNRVTYVHPLGIRGPAFLVGDLFIWGFTGHLLDFVLEAAGWALPWDVAREESIPERFRHGKR